MPRMPSNPNCCPHVNSCISRAPLIFLCKYLELTLYFWFDKTVLVKRNLIDNCYFPLSIDGHTSPPFGRARMNFVNPLICLNKFLVSLLPTYVLLLILFKLNHLYFVFNFVCSIYKEKQLLKGPFWSLVQVWLRDFWCWHFITVWHGTKQISPRGFIFRNEFVKVFLSVFH